MRIAWLNTTAKTQNQNIQIFVRWRTDWSICVCMHGISARTFPRCGASMPRTASAAVSCVSSARDASTTSNTSAYALMHMPSLTLDDADEEDEEEDDEECRECAGDDVWN